MESDILRLLLAGEAFKDVAILAAATYAANELRKLARNPLLSLKSKAQGVVGAVVARVGALRASDKAKVLEGVLKALTDDEDLKIGELSPLVKDVVNVYREYKSVPGAEEPTQLELP